MNEEFIVLKLVSRRLESIGVPFMVTGSIAGNLYAVARMTRDIDIVIDLKIEDAESVYALFKDDFYVELQTIKDEIKRRGMFNIIHNGYSLKVDFIVRKQSIYRELEFSRRTTVRVDDFQLPIVSLEYLVLSKLVWARDSHSALQLHDIKNLLNSAREIDHKYLEEWIPRLNLETIHKKALE